MSSIQKLHYSLFSFFNILFIFLPLCFIVLLIMSYFNMIDLSAITILLQFIEASQSQAAEWFDGLNSSFLISLLAIFGGPAKIIKVLPFLFMFFFTKKEQRPSVSKNSCVSFA